MSGLAKKSIDLTLEIESYLAEVAKITPGTPLVMLVIKGQMLQGKARLLMQDLTTAAEDKEIQLTALQIREGLKIEAEGLNDVVVSLQTADHALILSKQAVLEKQIGELKNKL